jgi:thiamine-phosphate pyrophosphorylase
MSPFPVPCVYLVTDRRRLSPDARTTGDQVRALEGFLDEALEAGVDAIQLRERDLPARQLGALAARIGMRAGGRARVLVNDRADVALAAGVDGVHLRSDGPPVVAVRRLGPSGFIVGKSVHTPEEAGGELEADYVLFGTVFPSASKPGSSAAGGLERLRDATSACHRPVVAIGGITPERAAEARAAGAAGVAAIGVFLPPGRAWGGLGVKEAVRAIRAALQPR